MVESVKRKDKRKDKFKQYDRNDIKDGDEYIHINMVLKGNSLNTNSLYIRVVSGLSQI